MIFNLIKCCCKEQKTIPMHCLREVEICSMKIHKVFSGRSFMENQIHNIHHVKLLHTIRAGIDRTEPRMTKRYAYLPLQSFDCVTCLSVSLRNAHVHGQWCDVMVKFCQYMVTATDQTYQHVSISLHDQPRKFPSSSTAHVGNYLAHFLR